MIDTLKTSGFRSEDLFLCMIFFFKNPGKLKTHWLGTYIVEEINNEGAVKLQELYGTLVTGLIKGILLKPYHDSFNLIA